MLMTGSVLTLNPLNGGRVPGRKTQGAAGFDCYVRTPITVPVLCAVKVPLGFSVSLPRGSVGFVVLRSSAALERGIFMPGGMGVIDEDYPDEVHAIVAAYDRSCDLGTGDRIAQLIVVPRFLVDDGVKAERRGGFGSTGR